MAKAKKSAEKKQTQPRKRSETKPGKKKETGSNYSEAHECNVVVHKKDESEQPADSATE